MFTEHEAAQLCEGPLPALHQLLTEEPPTPCLLLSWIPGQFPQLGCPLLVSAENYNFQLSNNSHPGGDK